MEILKEYKYTNTGIYGIVFNNYICLIKMDNDLYCVNHVNKTESDWADHSIQVFTDTFADYLTALDCMLTRIRNS